MNANGGKVSSRSEENILGLDCRTVNLLKLTRFDMKMGEFDGMCFSLLGVLQQSTTDWVTETTQMHCLTAVEAGYRRSSCGQG